MRLAIRYIEIRSLECPFDVCSNILVLRSMIFAHKLFVPLYILLFWCKLNWINPMNLRYFRKLLRNYSSLIHFNWKKSICLVAFLHSKFYNMIFHLTHGCSSAFSTDWRSLSQKWCLWMIYNSPIANFSILYLLLTDANQSNAKTKRKSQKFSEVS